MTEQEKLDNLKIANLKLRLENSRLKTKIKALDEQAKSLKAQVEASTKFLTGGSKL